MEAAINQRFESQPGEINHGIVEQVSDQTDPIKARSNSRTNMEQMEDHQLNMGTSDIAQIRSGSLIELRDSQEIIPEDDQEVEEEDLVKEEILGKLYADRFESDDERDNVPEGQRGWMPKSRHVSVPESRVSHSQEEVEIQNIHKAAPNQNGHQTAWH